jgi:hypothetical protein
MGTNHFGISAGFRAMLNMSQRQCIFSLLSSRSFVTLPTPPPQSQMTLMSQRHNLLDIYIISYK